jgi:hypothetical protein
MACDSHVIAAAPFELKMPTSSQTGLLLIRTSAELLLLLWGFFFPARQFECGMKGMQNEPQQCKLKSAALSIGI